MIKYRDYKNANNTKLRMGLTRELSLGKVQDEDFDEFKLLVNNLLQSHVVMKEKCVRGNKVLLWRVPVF